MPRSFLLLSDGGPTGAESQARLALGALPAFATETAAARVRHALDFAAISALRDRIRAFRPDVLHAVGSGAARSVALLKLPRVGLTPFPRLVVSGCAAPDGWLARRGLARADAVLAYSPGEAERYRGWVRPERVHRVPPGVVGGGSGFATSPRWGEVGCGATGRGDSPEEMESPLPVLASGSKRPPPSGERWKTKTASVHGSGTPRPVAADPDSITIAAVGNFDRCSGLKTAVWAFDVLKYVSPALQLLLIGDGPNRAAVDGFGRALGSDDYRVQFAGLRTDVPDLLAAADVVWVTHEFGGVTVCLEALAAGTPVVAMRTADTESVIADGETGVLVPSGDRVALASATAELLKRPDDLRRFGENARRAAAQFPPGALADATAAVYDARN